MRDATFAAPTVPEGLRRLYRLRNLIPSIFFYPIAELRAFVAELAHLWYTPFFADGRR